MSPPAVKVRDLHKRFEGSEVLQGIEFEVKKNELVLLMGPNGSGKTILLACIAGGLSPSSGDIRIFDRPPVDAKEMFNFMLQGELAIPNLTGRENLKFYSDLHPRTNQEWQEITDMLGIEEDLDRLVRDYSGGMTRKLEISIALSADVPLFLLDEPTSELDLTTIDNLHSLLRDRVDREKTILMTSHIAQDVDLADRILFVNNGQIVNAGIPSELRESLPQVVRLQSPGQADLATLSKFLRAEKTFENGREYRGFLQDKVGINEVRAAFDSETRVTVDKPSAQDMFNFYTHVGPLEDMK